MRGEGSAAGTEGLVGEPKFHRLGKCTMKPTNTHSHWMSNAFSGPCIELHHINSLFYILRSNTQDKSAVCAAAALDCVG